MNVSVKFISFILVIALSFALFSCAEDSPARRDTDDVANETTAGNTADTELKDSLPNTLDFGGETVNVYHFASGSQFYVESETGDLINDALYARNRSVEERLNVKINQIYEDVDWNDNLPVTKIRASIAAGDNNFDLIGGWGQKLTSLCTEGLFMNMYNVPYLTLSEPWWNKSMQKELTIGGKLYFSSGDIYLYFLQNTYCIGFNKSLVSEYKLPNLYEIVSDGKWTIDRMGELVKNVYKDVNGDGARGSEDLY